MKNVGLILTTLMLFSAIKAQSETYDARHAQKAVDLVRKSPERWNLFCDKLVNDYACDNALIAVLGYAICYDNANYSKSRCASNSIQIISRLASNWYENPGKTIPQLIANQMNMQKSHSILCSYLEIAESELSLLCDLQLGKLSSGIVKVLN